MKRALLVTVTLALVAACGPGASTSPQAPATKAGDDAPDAATTKSAAVAPADLDADPTEIGMSAAGVDRMCDGGLARAELTLSQIRALDGASDDKLTWDATLGALDEIALALHNGSDFAALMAVAHPDEAVRTHANGCEPKVDAFATALLLDARVASVVKRYAAKREPLDPVRARMLEHTLRDFRRNGLELGTVEKKRLAELNRQITELAQQFDANLAASTLSMEVAPEALAGMPKEFVANHQPGAGGKIRLTTNYPDVFPFLQYAKDRATALELYKLFDNRAADKNLAILDRVLALRHEKARLLGYATWADYVTEPRMSGSAKAVDEFLARIKAHVAGKAARELAELRAMHKKLGGDPRKPIPPSDRTYLEDRVREAKYGVDSKRVSEYFEVDRVKKGLLTITGQLFGLEYAKVDAPVWHSDVEAFEVRDRESKALLGRFYFDLYPRDAKYKHAAVFSIRDTRARRDGSRLTPIAAIVCNFPKPGGAAPALMAHHEVTTFFHEFGHVLHHLLSDASLATFAGSRVARDFVEAPSQMLEEWAWAKETLDLFARHHATDKPLPKELHAAMLRSRSFGRALATQRQLSLAALDFTYHTKAPPFDTTEVLERVQNEYTAFKYVPGTHFQATFGHLMGYDAGYYGYQWALSIAQDLFTRFKREGLLSPKTAMEYRRAVLAPGGSFDEKELVRRFLGRAPNDEAYKAFLVE